MNNGRKNFQKHKEAATKLLEAGAGRKVIYDNLINNGVDPDTANKIIKQIKGQSFSKYATTFVVGSILFITITFILMRIIVHYLELAADAGIGP